MAYSSFCTRRQLCLGLTLLCVFSMTTVFSRECEVITSLGGIIGSIMTSYKEREFCAYRGIPYAKPPVDDLRFKDPQPVSSWNETLRAKHDSPKCIQQKKSYIVGKEDCLHLNVYTPVMNSTKDSYKSLLPVIMYIHGGRFKTGGCLSHFTGPLYLLDKDIVFVTINYRLGVLGFLSTGDDELPGNYGMKDQVAAMKWIQQHIVNFGGDPNKVTLQGQNTGGTSVHYHLFSPLARGLFNAAISQSWSAFMHWVLPTTNPLEKAKEQAKAVGCLRNSTREMVQCFQKTNVTELMHKQLKNHYWAPVIEEKSENNLNPYITAAVFNLVKEGDFAMVPWLIGGNSQDGAYFKAKLLSKPHRLEKFYKNIDREGPKELLLSHSVKKSGVPDVWKRIADFYFGTDRPQNTKENNNKLKDLFTDRFSLHSIHKAVVEHSKAGHKPIFYYNFGYRGIYSYADLITHVPQDIGVVQSDELIYLISSNVFTTWPPMHPDLQALDKMVTLWTNFATYWDPTPSKESKSGDFVWKPVEKLKNNSGYIAFLNISNEILVNFAYGPITVHMDKDPYQERMKFMDSLPLRENQYE